jgi:EmrB/QacA subfamily drug resistance transporter
VTVAGSAAPSMAEAGRGRWLGLAMLSVGVSMIIVDATIVNVAVPRIIRDLDLDSASAEWVNTTYALVFAALLVTLGRIGDVIGRRRLYLAGLALFGAASVVAGAAPTGELLIAARLLQGLGGAMILPATQSILNTNFRGRDRAIAFGIWGAVIGGMAAVGPLIGGWLTTNLSWRWAFYVNVPVGLIAMLGTLRYIGESRDEEAHAGFDLPGFLLVTTGLGGFVFGLIEGRTYGWLEPTASFSLFGLVWPLGTVSIIPVALGWGLVALALFIVVEHRRARAGRFFLFDVDLWRYPGFRYGNLAGTIVSLGEFGLLFALPLFLQAVIGYTPFETGLVFMALAIGAFFAAPVSASIAGRFGPRRAVTLGLLLEVVGIAGTSLLISSDVSGLALGIPLLVYGLGVGLATAQLTSIVLSDIPPERSGLASGANSTMRQVGSAFGIAILGTTLFTAIGTGVHDRLSTVPGLPPAAVDGIATAMEASAGQALVTFREQPEMQAVVPEIEAAFVDATRIAGLVATAFVVVGVGLSLLLPETRPRHARTRLPDGPGPPEPTQGQSGEPPGSADVEASLAGTGPPPPGAADGGPPPTVPPGARPPAD